MFLGKSSQHTIFDAEVGAAYKACGDDVLAVIIREVDQLKTYPYSGELIVERGRTAEAGKNVPELARPIVFDMCGVSSDGKYRLLDKNKIASYSNDFVLKPTKSLRSLAIRDAIFVAAQAAAVGEVFLTFLLLATLATFHGFNSLMNPVFLVVIFGIYVLWWLFIFTGMLDDRMAVTPYSLSFNADKLHNVKTKSGHDVILSESGDVEKIYGSIILKPEVYENGILVKEAVLLLKVWNNKGETDGDAYALVNCKSERSCNEINSMARRTLNLRSILRFCANTRILRNKSI